MQLWRDAIIKGNVMNGCLMHFDEVVLRIENDIICDDNTLLPLRLNQGANIECWVKCCAIDKRRANFRLLKKVMRIT